MPDDAPSAGAAPPAPAPLPMFTCDDCGRSFQGDAKAHYDATHASMPRMRYSDGEFSYIECRHRSHSDQPWVSKADLGEHTRLGKRLTVHQDAHEEAH